MTERDGTGGGVADEAVADDIVVVLSEPQDLVNIAGAVRAMRNMGLDRLRLVRPAEYDAYRIAGIAHGSEPLLERIEFFDALPDAVGDAVHVVGTTARRRAAPHVWQHPREAAPEILDAAAGGVGPVALVFGREDKGLSNEELDACDRLVTIPTDPRHSSLNLAQAVLVLAYELFLARAGTEKPLPRPRRMAPPATAAETRQLFQDVEASLAAIDFFKSRKPDAILRSLRALARRADMDRREARLLRAIALEVRKVLARAAG